MEVGDSNATGERREKLDVARERRAEVEHGAAATRAAGCPGAPSAPAIDDPAEPHARPEKARPREPRHGQLRGAASGVSGLAFAPGAEALPAGGAAAVAGFSCDSISTLPRKQQPSSRPTRGAVRLPSMVAVFRITICSLATRLPRTSPATLTTLAWMSALTRPDCPTVTLCFGRAIFPSTLPRIVRSSLPVTSPTMEIDAPMTACSRRSPVAAGGVAACGAAVGRMGSSSRLFHIGSRSPDAAPPRNRATVCPSRQGRCALPHSGGIRSQSRWAAVRALARTAASSTVTTRRSRRTKRPATIVERTWLRSRPKSRWPARFSRGEGSRRAVVEDDEVGGSPGVQPPQGKAEEGAGEPVPADQHLERRGEGVGAPGVSHLQEGDPRLGQHVLVEAVRAEGRAPERDGRRVANGVVHVRARAVDDPRARGLRVPQLVLAQVHAVDEQRPGGRGARAAAGARRGRPRSASGSPRRRPGPRPRGRAGSSCRPERPPPGDRGSRPRG